MVKSGQAALEFMMTYGWALLGTIAAVGALTYYGFLDFDLFTPETCKLFEDLSCYNYAISPSKNMVTLIVGNSFTSQVRVTEANLTQGGCTKAFLNSGEITRANPRVFNVGTGNNLSFIECTSLSGSRGRFNSDVRLEYQIGQSQILHQKKGNLNIVSGSVS